MADIDYKAMYEAQVTLNEALLAQKAQKGPATKGETFASRWKKQCGCDAMLFCPAIKLGYTAEQVSPFPKDKLGFMVRCGDDPKNGNKTNRCGRHMNGNKWELDRPWKQVEMFMDEKKLRPYFIMNDADGNVTEPKDMPQPARPQQRATSARGKGVTTKLKEALETIDELKEYIQKIEGEKTELENQFRRLSVGQPDSEGVDEPVAETTSADTLPFESDQEEQSPPPSATSSASTTTSQSSEGDVVAPAKSKGKKVYTREKCLKQIKKYHNRGQEGDEKKVKTWQKRLNRVLLTRRCFDNWKSCCA